MLPCAYFFNKCFLCTYIYIYYVDMRTCKCMYMYVHIISNTRLSEQLQIIMYVYSVCISSITPWRDVNHYIPSLGDLIDWQVVASQPSCMACGSICIYVYGTIPTYKLLYFIWIPQGYSRTMRKHKTCSIVQRSSCLAMTVGL